MAMVIMNNGAAMQALHENDKNSNKLSKDLQKVASGMKINGAGDGAAEFAVSEKMRVMIRSLGQDIENAKKGIDLVKTAEEGIQSIIDELRSMKEMAINSANDHNSDMDRRVLQNEFASKMNHINDIASTTDYNGRYLLDGTWHSPLEKVHIVTEVIDDGSGSSGSGSSSGGTEGTGGTGESGSSTGGTEETGGTEGTEEVLPPRPTSEVVTKIPAGDYTISTDGIYEFEADYTGNVTITAQNVELRQEGTDYLSNAEINCINSNTNLWLNGLNIVNYAKNLEGTSLLRFTGTGNTLNLIANNMLYHQVDTDKALVNVGGGLVINDGDDTGRLYVSSSFMPSLGMGQLYTGAAIGSDSNENSNAYIIINSGVVTTNVGWVGVPYSETKGVYGAGIGSGKDGSIGMIAVNGGTVVAESCVFGAGIGSGYNGMVNGNIVIRDGTVGVTAGCNSKLEGAAGAAMGAGENGSVNGDIIIKGGTVTATSQGTGAAIGLGSYDSSGSAGSLGNIVIKNCSVNAKSMGGAAIGYSGVDKYPAFPATFGKYYDRSKYEPTLYGLTTDIGELQVYGGNYSERFVAYYAETLSVGGDLRTEKIYHVYTRDESDTTGADAPDGDTGDPPESKIKKEEESSGTGESGGSTTEPGDPGEATPPTVITREEREYIPGNPLIIHYGPKQNQHLRVYINDMHSKAMGLDNVVIDPLEEARKALSKLDSALEYALTENTFMGSYQKKLQYTIDNNTVAEENVTSAESVIRDADMAKSMMAYVKDNILTQTSQAMLAQANQNSGAVLRLLE